MPLTTTSSVRQLSDGNFLFGGPGNTLGQSNLDGVAFFGATPVVQPAGQSQAAVTRGSAAGVVATILSAVASPTTPGTLTTAEKTFTLVTAAGSNFQVATTDVVFVNKPTSQAGLGVGNVRVSAGNTLAVTFSGVNATTVTPTASQSYSVVALRGFSPLSGTLTPAAVPANTIAEQQFALAGVRPNELVQVNKPTSQAGLDVVGCRVVASGTVGITFMNVTASPITPTAAEVYTVVSLGGIDAVNNDLLVQELFSPGTISASTSAEQTLVTTGLATTDTITGISKPTAQAGLGIANQRISTAGTLGLTFGNFTASPITITATETYSIALKRPNPVAPLVVQSAALTPTSVAALTTAEQLFAVPNIVASAVAWVNKPSATPGLGIAGVRVAAAGTIAINFVNSSAAAIVPPAETYIVGNFQLPVGDASSTWLQTASVVDTQQSALANALRTGLVNLGLVAGA
jgi:hypothetical protein